MSRLQTIARYARQWAAARPDLGLYWSFELRRKQTEALVDKLSRREGARRVVKVLAQAIALVAVDQLRWQLETRSPGEEWWFVWGEKATRRDAARLETFWRCQYPDSNDETRIRPADSKFQRRDTP